MFELFWGDITVLVLIEVSKCLAKSFALQALH